MKWYSVLLSVFLLQSCSNSSQKNSLPETSNEAIIPSKENSCLLNHATQYDKLLTLEEAANAIGQSPAGAKVKYNKALKNTAYHEVVYSWETSRTVEKYGVEIPEDDVISASHIQKKTLKDFKRDYTKRTEEEIAALNEQMSRQLDKQFDEKSDNEKIEKAKQKMKDVGVSHQTGKKTAKKIGSTLSSSLSAYEEVPGLGDAASWNTKDKNLYVLSGGVQFCVRTNLGSDDAKNKQTAISLAKLILQKCN